MKNALIIILACLSILEISGQKEVSFPKEVNLVKMTDAGIAIVGTDDSLYGVDSEGNTVWKNDKLKKVEAARVQIMDGSEYIFVSDKGLGRNRIINVLTGEEAANNGVRGVGMLGARLIHGMNQVWTMTNGIEVWDLASNTMIYNWDKFQFPYGLDTQEMANLTATFDGCQPITYTGESSAIIHAGLGHLGNFDLTNGEPIWMFDWKPYKIKKDKGFQHSSPSKGYSVMKIDEATQTLYFPFMDQLISIDINNGQANWDPKKGGQTGKVRDLYVVDEGILLLTLKGLMLIDKKTGEKKWDKYIKIKGADSGLLMQDGDDFYTVSKGSIMRVDVSNRKAELITDKIKFSGNETFDNLEVVDNTIVLSSSQNVVGIDKSTGKLIHQSYFKAPGNSLLTIAQNIALAAVALAATYNSQQINAQNTVAVNGVKNVRYHQYTPNLMSDGGPATQSNGTHLYINTKFKDSDAQGFGLAKVDKTTGEVVEKILTGEREAIYATNERDKLIFFKSGKSKVVIKEIL